MTNVYVVGGGGEHTNTLQAFDQRAYKSVSTPIIRYMDVRLRLVKSSNEVASTVPNAHLDANLPFWSRH